VRIAPEPFPGGVDTVEDLERVRAVLASQENLQFRRS
jgi:CMP-2-keto-3-deoxyoctulosonic acid synthetase